MTRRPFKVITGGLSVGPGDFLALAAKYERKSVICLLGAGVSAAAFVLEVIPLVAFLLQEMSAPGGVSGVSLLKHSLLPSSTVAVSVWFALGAIQGWHRAGLLRLLAALQPPA